MNKNLIGLKKEPSARVRSREGQFLWVVKFGSGLVVNEDGINNSFINNTVKQVSSLRARSLHTILVGSGARACGEYYYQGNISLGQKRLFEGWSQAFGRYGIEVGEHLVMDWDLVGRGSERFRRKLWDNLEKGLISLINGDDCRLRENDRAINNDYVVYRIATIMNVTTLINLTNVAGVINTEGRVVRVIRSRNDLDNVQFNGKSDLGKGGMKVKLKYMKRFAKNRLVYICNGNDENILQKVFEGKAVGTKIQL